MVPLVHTLGTAELTFSDCRERRELIGTCNAAACCSGTVFTAHVVRWWSTTTAWCHFPFPDDYPCCGNTEVSPRRATVVLFWLSFLRIITLLELRIKLDQSAEPFGGSSLVTTHSPSDDATISPVNIVVVVIIMIILPVWRRFLRLPVGCYSYRNIINCVPTTLQFIFGLRLMYFRQPVFDIDQSRTPADNRFSRNYKDSAIVQCVFVKYSFIVHRCRHSWFIVPKVCRSDRMTCLLVVRVSSIF